MFKMDKLDRHAELVNRMAETVGAELGEALISGKLSDIELRNAVVRCTGCSSPDTCEHWLEDHSAGAETPPGYCRNSALLSRLRD